MAYHVDDTIAAVASASGGATRGLIRLSGPQATQVLSGCFRAHEEVRISHIRSPKVLAGEIELPSLQARMACELYLWPTLRSYTRQPLAELHVIGSPPMLEAVLDSLCRCGARLAEPGEFTLRAFLAGRIDLPQAEAVLGVIDARGQQELDTALSQLAGGLSGPLTQIRGELLDLLAELEAGLDFAEEDLQFISAEELKQRLGVARRHLENIVAQLAGRNESAGEVNIVLVGPPNAGKSSLLNALINEDAAIVSPIAGTTRDYVTRRVKIDGLDCLLVDTAGLDAFGEEASIEAASQNKTQEQANSAHVQLFCIDGSRPLSAAELPELKRIRPGRILVLTKGDLPQVIVPNQSHLVTSSATKTGIDLLKRAISAMVREQASAETAVVASTSARCRASLFEAKESVARAETLAEWGGNEELIAAEIRAALDGLGRVVGEIYTDEILDRIFSRFCIGK